MALLFINRYLIMAPGLLIHLYCHNIKYQTYHMATIARDILSVKGYQDQFKWTDLVVKTHLMAKIL